MKGKKYELAVETKENVVGGGTIVMDCGLNYHVVVDAPYESNAPPPIPIPDKASLLTSSLITITRSPLEQEAPVHHTNWKLLLLWCII